MSSAGDKTKPKLINQEVEASYHVVITCDVEVDLSDPKLDVEFPLAKVPFAGDWKLWLYREDNKLKAAIGYGTGEPARIGSDVLLSLAVFSLRHGIRQQLESIEWGRESFPALDEADGKPYAASVCTLNCANWPSFASKGHQAYRYQYTLEQQALGLTVPSEGPVALASRLADFHLEQIPSQLRLFFPNIRKGGVELWVSSKLLSKAAPYFKDLLASDFSEATPRRSKRARKSGAQPLPAPAEKDFDDSDDETDAFLLEKKPPKLSESNEASEQPFREITITQTSFSTYHAFLVYLETGYIRFAPLRSASSPSNPSASSTRDDFLSEHSEDYPPLPFPISPKSMFRLADLLRLTDEDPLTSLCLRAFSDSLTHHGAALELFSDISVCFDKIRKIALESVVKNWDAVSETSSWKEKMDKIDAGELPDVAPILVALLKAREEAWKKEKTA